VLSFNLDNSADDRSRAYATVLRLSVVVVSRLWRYALLLNGEP